MENTNIENIYDEVVDSDEVKPKRKWNPNPNGRVKSAFWRYREDGTYNNNPISESYYRDYYKEHLSAIYVECPYCKKQIGKHNYPRHLTSGKSV